MSKKHPDGDDAVFGFDDVFVPRFVHRTYHQLRQDGFKFSSRDMALGDYVR